MHDCRATQEELVDLVFDEMPGARKARLLAEVEACAACRAEYASLAETLNVFDQATEVALPQERYWPGYETRLRARLAEESRPRARRWLAGLFGGFEWPSFSPNWLVPAAVALVLFALAAGWWLKARPNRQGGSQIEVASGERTPAPSPTRAPRVPTPQPSAQENLTPPASGEPAPSPRRKRVERKIEREIDDGPAPTPPDLARAVLPTENVAPLADPDLIRHFEQSEMLLRSFRNVEVSAAAPPNVTFEKRQSRELLYRNVLLRRSAEAAGDLPVAELLGSLEPVLLDIKNLPDRASGEDVQPIKDRIRRKGLVGTLNVYAAQTVAMK
jgi:hypothetical protein